MIRTWSRCYGSVAARRTGMSARVPAPVPGERRRACPAPLPDLGSLGLNVGMEAPEASPSDKWVTEQGELVVSDSSSKRAEWASFGPTGSAFEMRVTSFPDVELRDGSERANNDDGLREYEESCVRKGRLTVATLHNRDTRVRKLYNVFFLANGARNDVDPYAAANIVERQLRHMPRNGEENRRCRAAAKTRFKAQLVEQVTTAVDAVHNAVHTSTAQVAEGEATVEWWLEAMFALHLRTDDDFCEQLRARTASPMATLAFGSLVQTRQLAGGHKEKNFLSDDGVAEMWINNGEETDGEVVWTEDDMIDTLFFKGKRAVLCKSPVFGGFFHMPKKLLTRVATSMDFEGMDDVARGTADNGWTWTMSERSKSKWAELLADECAAAAERKEKKAAKRKCPPSPDAVGGADRARDTLRRVAVTPKPMRQFHRAWMVDPTDSTVFERIADFQEGSDGVESTFDNLHFFPSRSLVTWSGHSDDRYGFNELEVSYSALAQNGTLEEGDEWRDQDVGFWAAAYVGLWYAQNRASFDWNDEDELPSGEAGIFAFGDEPATFGLKDWEVSDDDHAVLMKLAEKLENWEDGFGYTDYGKTSGWRHPAVVYCLDGGIRSTPSLKVSHASTAYEVATRVWRAHPHWVSRVVLVGITPELAWTPHGETPAERLKSLLKCVVWANLDVPTDTGHYNSSQYKLKDAEAGTDAAYREYVAWWRDHVETFSPAWEE